MAALDFPASPVNNQVFNAPNGVAYVYDATRTVWMVQPVSAGFVGDFTAWGNAVAPTVSATGGFYIFPTILSGNAGGWYNTSNGRFTPPKGRYLVGFNVVVSNNASAIIYSVDLYKNGAFVMRSGGTTFAANNPQSAALAVEVDANGTDYFQVYGGGNGTGINVGNYGSFFAIPVSPNANMTQGTGDFCANQTSGFPQSGDPSEKWTAFAMSAASRTAITGVSTGRN